MKKKQIHIALSTFTLLVVVLFAACSSKPEDARPEMKYEGGGVTFSLRDIDGLYSTPLDSLPWAGGIVYNPQNSPLAYFFLSPADLNLSAPHIRVEYMSRSLQFCESSDSVLGWLKDHFLVQQRGILVTDRTELKTYSGKNALFMEIATPDVQMDSVIYPGKNMAWAYIDGDTSLIGMNFTAQDKGQYATGLVLFKELVQTYDEP